MGLRSKGRYRSTISEKEIERYKREAEETKPFCRSVTNLSTSELIDLGADRMKKDGFKMSYEEIEMVDEEME